MDEDFKNRVLESIDIIDIINDVVELRKRGANFIGLCPFHNEKTPSFNVSQDKGIYKCFGCGKSGNAITFMIDYHGFSFVEATKELAKRAGIPLPEERGSKKYKQEMTRKDFALSALQASGEYFSKLLASNAGKTGKDYFNGRGFSPALIKEFTLGYSADNWDSLMQHLKKLNFTEQNMLDAGLIIERENGGGHYDRYRGRAMFPIHNVFGKIIGFGARQLSDDPNQPKYINSPQTMIYDKSKTLYGLYQGKSHIINKKAVILVEGYADVLSLHQAGYKNSVASSGTSLTKEQLIVLERYCKKLYMVYDADNAGIKATERGLELAITAGFDVLVVRLPAGEDPDSLIRKHGGQIFLAYLNDAVSFIEFKLDLYKKQGELESPAGRSNAIRSIINIISSIPDRLQHDDYISKLASTLHLSVTQVENIYKEKKTKEAENKSKEKRPVQNIAKSENKPDEKIFEDNDPLKSEYIVEDDKVPDRELKLSQEETYIFQVIFNEQEAMSIIVNEMMIESQMFMTDDGMRFYKFLKSNFHNGTLQIRTLLNNKDLAKSEIEFITNTALDYSHYSENWDRYTKNIQEQDLRKLLQDVFIKIKLLKVEKEYEILQEQLKSLKPDIENFNESSLNILGKLKEISTVRNHLAQHFKG